MAEVRDALYEEEVNCLTSDLVGGFPVATTYPEGTLMYVWDGATKELDAVFKLHSASGTKAWYKI